jgi:hypothetical protein
MVQLTNEMAALAGDLSVAAYLVVNYTSYNYTFTAQ